MYRFFFSNTLDVSEPQPQPKNDENNKKQKQDFSLEEAIQIILNFINCYTFYKSADRLEKNTVKISKKNSEAPSNFWCLYNNIFKNPTECEYEKFVQATNIAYNKYIDEIKSVIEDNPISNIFFMQNYGNDVKDILTGLVIKLDARRRKAIQDADTDDARARSLNHTPSPGMSRQPM